MLYVYPYRSLIMRETYNKKIRARIIKVVSDEPFLHLSEIAIRSKTMRITARKHLERLEREGVVRETKRGVMRLFTLREVSGNDE